MSGLNAVTTPVDVVAPTAGVANYYPLPFDSDIRNAIVSADFDGAPTSVITLSNSSLHYAITGGDLALFNGAGAARRSPSSGRATRTRCWTPGGPVVSSRSSGIPRCTWASRTWPSRGGEATDGFLGSSAAVGGGVLIDGGSVAMTNVASVNNLAVGASGTGGNGGDAQGGGIFLGGGSSADRRPHSGQWCGWRGGRQRGRGRPGFRGRPLRLVRRADGVQLHHRRELPGQRSRRGPIYPGGLGRPLQRHRRPQRRGGRRPGRRHLHVLQFVVRPERV